jgi:hypothetical protein
MKKYLLITLSVMIGIASLDAQNREFKPGEKWLDVDNNVINAHGGGFLYYEGSYYWYGELKQGKTWKVPNSNWENFRVVAGGVSCYSSKRPAELKYEGVALSSNKMIPAMNCMNQE